MSLSLKDLLKLVQMEAPRQIDEATWDGQSVPFSDAHVAVVVGELLVKIRATVKGHQVLAEHKLDDSRNAVSLDGQALAPADVDVDFDQHLGWFAVEYHLQFVQDSQSHEIVLTARVSWAEVPLPAL